MFALRSLAGAEVLERLTQHRFWTTLDYVQLLVFQTTGFIAPNMRAYQLCEKGNKNYIERRFPEDKARAVSTPKS
jgi:hypothetical protein